MTKPFTRRQYLIDITMPSGEKLPTYPIDRDAFLLSSAHDIACKLASDITRLIEQRLKA